VEAMSEDLDYSIRIPLAKMSLADQERFWVVEGRIKRQVKFDAGFGYTTKGPCRDWELDWSLSGDLSAQDIMDWLKTESIPFTVRVSVTDPNMRD
jgi:hypothetical protein